MTIRGIIGKGPVGELPADRQVGGNHYSKMKIQPSRFARANDYDCDAFSILKYLSRHRSKKGREDVEKALSFVDIRLDNAEFLLPPRINKICMVDYIAMNQIYGRDAKALYILDAWVKTDDSTFIHPPILVTGLRDAIQDILEQDYPLI